MIDVIAVVLIVIGSVIGSLATIILKKGTNVYMLKQLWKTRYFWGGLVLYGLSVIVYLLALPREELSVLYPLVSMNYLFTTLFSVCLLGEKMNRWKWWGLAGIVVGVVLIGWRS